MVSMKLDHWFSVQSPKWCIITMFYNFEVKVCELWRHICAAVIILDAVDTWAGLLHRLSRSIVCPFLQELCSE